MYEGKFIIAPGPAIIKDNQLPINKYDKDDFYKLPGETIEEETEDLESACHREVLEETNAKIKIIKLLHPMQIWKNPQTKERMAITLIHWEAKLLNKDEIKSSSETIEVRWLDINEIKEGKHNVTPNIKFLIKKGDIK